MSSILPAVGTVYPSLPAFKLDLFERGLRNSLHFTTRSVAPNVHSYVHCGIKIGLEKDYCTCRVVARNLQGVITVTTVETEHSCEGHDTEPKRIAARSKMQEMVVKARREKEEFENTAAFEGDTAVDQDQDIQPDDSSNTTPYGDREWNDQFEGSSQEDSDFDSNESDKATTPAPTRQRDRGPRVSKQEFQQIYPPARDVQGEIDQLKQRSTVHLPSPIDSFDAPRKLLVVLYAFAQQRNFSIHRGYPRPEIKNPATIRMHCYRHHAQYKNAPNGGRCRFTLHASKNQDGTWRLDPVTSDHNHDVLQIAQLTQTSNQGVRRTTDFIETSEPQLSLPITSNFSYNPFPLTSANHHQNSFDTISRFSQYQPLAPLAPVPSSHSSDLIAFLRSFHFSPTTLPHLLKKLHESGLSRPSPRDPHDGG